MKEDGEIPVRDARVEVTAGPAAGLFAVTSGGSDWFGGGGYRLLGVPGDTEFRVTKDGYQPLVRTLRVTDHQQIDFELAPAIPRVDVSGTYALTVTADADCGVALPEDVRTRTFAAVLTQDGAGLNATLAGDNFVTDDDHTYNSFRGAVEPDRVWFRLREFVVGDPLGDSTNPSTSFSDVFVQLTPSTFLAVSGFVAATTVSRAHLSGTLAGVIQIVQRFGAGPLDWRTLASCRSADQQFVLSRPAG